MGSLIVPSLLPHDQPFSNTLGRTPVQTASAPGTRTMVGIFPGQSHWANFIADGNDIDIPYFTPSLGIDNADWVNDGRIYRAAEPLIGCDGVGSSILTRLANLYKQAGLCDRFVIYAMASNGSWSPEWSREGTLNKLIPIVCARVLQAFPPGTDVDMFIDWQLMDSDVIFHTRPDIFRGWMREAINTFRENGLLCRQFLNLSGYLGGITTVADGVPWAPTNAAIRAEVQGLCDGVDVVLGADFNTLGDAYRHPPQHIHFNGAGADAVAQLKLTRHLQFSQTR